MYQIYKLNELEIKYSAGYYLDQRYKTTIQWQNKYQEFSIEVSIDRTKILNSVCTVLRERNLSGGYYSSATGIKIIMK